MHISTIFYIAVDRALKILHIGPVLQRLYPEIKPRDDFAKYFVIDRPNIPISFAAIVGQSRSLFSLFQIRDEGISISPEDLAKLFDSFHRGNNVSNIQETGLGFLIVKNCVEVHGDEITVNIPLTAGDDGC
jgi:signal transduction histidine kinase